MIVKNNKIDLIEFDLSPVTKMDKGINKKIIISNKVKFLFFLSFKKYDIDANPKQKMKPPTTSSSLKKETILELSGLIFPIIFFPVNFSKKTSAITTNIIISQFL
tara:strand:+ start:171 stop:485 length:315 start_codon:yes stop_codon:yes gene_type:complete